ncbi:MAG: DUF6790 family protein [Parachlamydiales bacterium]
MAILYLILVFALITGSVHLILAKRPYPPGRVWEVYLLSFFFWIGIDCLVSAFGHIYPPQAAYLAEQIGFAPSFFQYEVGIANLAVGVLCLMALGIRDHFWLATVVALSIWYLGDGVGHIIQLTAFDNHAPGNAGAPLVLDFLLPAITLLLYLLVKTRRVE